METVIEMLRRRRDTKSALKELTQRQLIKDYRLSVIQLNDVVTAYNYGRDYNMGIPIHRALSNAKWDFNAVYDELEARGINTAKLKNIEPFIVKLTSKELEAQLEAKKAKAEETIRLSNEQKKQEQQKPIIDAMNAAFTYAFNFEYDFIFKSGITPYEHMQYKWTEIYETGNPTKSFMRFWGECDTENRNKLMAYILNK